jgi:type III restriction enzyme
MPLRVPYHDVQGYLRHYTPDFIVKTDDGDVYLVETKGQGWDEMSTVRPKVEAAERWCQEVSKLTGERWRFVKILQSDFERFHTLPFGELVKASSPDARGTFG